MNVRRSGASVVAPALVAVGELVAAAAFACVNIATLQLSAASATAGSRVTATGYSYNAQQPRLAVVLRWNGVNGPELGRATPDDSGNITVAFTVPSVAPGFYVVVGVQRDAKGADLYGTPSHAAFEVLAQGASPTPTVATTIPAILAPPPAPAGAVTQPSLGTPTTRAPVPPPSPLATAEPASTPPPAPVAAADGARRIDDAPVAAAATGPSGDDPVPVPLTVVAAASLACAAAALASHTGRRRSHAARARR